MKKLTYLLIISLVFSCSVQEKPSHPLRLWYDEPAGDWIEALPVGNGRLGGMIYGGVENERIQVNEETLWTGQPHDYAHEDAHLYLDSLRWLLWEGRQEDAHKLGNAHFMSQPFGQQSYQPFCEIHMAFPGHKQAQKYARELNINNAISTVSYELEGVTYSREVFVSAPDQAIFIILQSSEKGNLNFESTLSTPHARKAISFEGDELILTGTSTNYSKELDRLGDPYPESKLTFEGRLKVIHNDGDLLVNGSSIRVSDASSVTLAFVGATSFVDYHDISAKPSNRCKEYLYELEKKSTKQIRDNHITDYQSFFDRFRLDLGKSEISYRPTDERLETFYKDEDPDLVSLLYQYGRYLLISSSRPGTQPANLQGIWNKELSPPWDSKYTTNINTEMNYWPAEISNLSDCAEPLFGMIEDLSVTGQNVAREHYNMEGWVFHHNADIWRGAAPINGSNHGIWVTGGAWLCQHLWWHYQYSGDREFLRERAYPVMKEASRFFTQYLVRDPANPGWLISGPSNSPEIGGLVMGPTMDHQIIRDLFANTIEAADILGLDSEFADLLREQGSRIAPNQIGAYGQLQEWLADVDDPENKHRHVSHLWGLHPGSEIHPLTTPELAEACKITLQHRGDGGTGWSRAWKINFWARLLEGDHSFLLLKNLIVPVGGGPADSRHKGGLYPNLLCAHPPFQIDGNFGATSGITEMILQSHLRDDQGNYILDVLPALPSALAEGNIRGVCARGGFELVLEWQGGKLVELEILSKLGNSCSIRYLGRMIQLDTEMGKAYSFGPDLELASF